MWIDVVAVFWIVAFFLNGPKTALLVSLLGAVVITLFAPDTWLGASMKWVATFPVWVALAVFQGKNNKGVTYYQKWSRLLLPLLVGIVIRSCIVIPLNYYYAIPIWTGMTPAAAIAAIPWYIIAGFNTVQAILDVVVAWIIVYRFGIKKYAHVQSETYEKGNTTH
jgi:riboflavin transporter FmnP